MIQPRVSGPQSTLSPIEQRKLACYEALIARSGTALADLGSGLAGIRDARLYRATHQTFEAYCVSRWDFGRRYVEAIIARTERWEDLGD